jgi:hypothetical protein
MGHGPSESIPWRIEQTRVKSMELRFLVARETEEHGHCFAYGEMHAGFAESKI